MKCIVNFDVDETANQKISNLQRLADLSEKAIKSEQVKHPSTRIRTLIRLEVYIDEIGVDCDAIFW